MAKIDTSKIEGFEEMTDEEKIAALEAYDIPDPDYTGYVKKELYDKVASDVADWKKKHNKLLSEDSQTKQEKEDEITTLRSKIEEMEKQNLVSANKAKFLGLGYDEDLAAETAQALVDGDNDKIFANHKKFIENHDKAYKAKLMGETSTPPAGNATSSAAPDYCKLIEDARSRGDYAAEAYYTRLSEQEKINNKGE